MVLSTWWSWNSGSTASADQRIASSAPCLQVSTSLGLTWLATFDSSPWQRMTQAGDLGDGSLGVSKPVMIMAFYSIVGVGV